ncbi:MAG: hypothetical protein GY852_10040, partial [bacterium]|nr:hypothetical protein [bacterium]
YWEEFAPENFLKHHKEFKDFLAKDSPIRKILGTPDYNLETEIRGVPREDLQEYSKFMGKFRGKVPTQPELEAMMQQLSEKANAGLKKGNLKLADSYAAMAGKILYENSEAIKKISKDPQEITKVFSEMFGDKLKGKVRLESLLRDYEGAVTVADRKSAAEKLKEWAKDNDAAGEERQVKVALLFNKYGEQRGDWYDLNNYTDVVRIRPAASTVPRDPSDLEAQPYEKVGGVKGFIKNVWNMGRQTWDPILNKANLGLEQFMLSTFGKQMKSEYEGSLTSEYFRETGAKFAAKLAAGDFGDMHDSRYASDPAIRQYNSLMDSFTRYHAIWDETITRDPRGNSSAIGSAFIYSGFFHHGPAMAFGPAPYRRWTHAGYQTPWTTWSGIKKNVRERLWGLQYTPAIFNWAVGTPFGVAYRTYITSRWGFMTKHDRKYKEDKAYSETVEKERKEYYQRAELNYEQQRKQYQEQFENTMSQYKSEGKSAEAARELASMDLAGQKPTPPSFELERDILKPYSETQPRMAEAHASMLNWFYASFDPTATNWKRFAAAAFSSPLLPVAQFIPSRWVQSKVLGNGSALLNREDSNPYYVSPQGMRSLMMKATGPMVKRQYGGTEMVTGVVRSHEDTWAYQSGVYAIWGNTNPGASYVDFSNSIHMDPRAANYLRYESRFRPFMEYDDYVDRQSKLGLVKRDIDPFQLMATRNAELRHYKFPQNTLFRFLNPATLAWYKGGAALGRVANVAGSVRDFFRGTSTQPVNGRLGQMKVGAGRLALRAGEAIDNYAYKKFDLRHTKSVRYCQSCQGPVAEGGTCPACARNVRCPYCSSSVNPSHNHNCSHGISRNLHNEQLSGAYADGQFERSLMSSSTARNRMFDHTFKSRTRDTWGRET